MKKIVATFLVSVLVALLMPVTPVFAQTRDAFDTVLYETAQNLLSEESWAPIDVTEKHLLLDLYDNPCGYVYSFEHDEKEGFAIVIVENEVPTVKEFFFDRINVYASYTGDYVYVGPLLYFVKIKGVYYNVDNGEEMSLLQIELVKAQGAYRNNGTFSYETEIVYFNSRTVDEWWVALDPPNYINFGITNGCAAIAGGNLLGFYDAYYTELIPNYTAAYLYYGEYIYYGQNSYAQLAMTTLATDMGIDSTGGATINSFKQGLIDYCARVNRNVSYSSCMTLGFFNYNTTKSYIDQEIPVAIFLSEYNICMLSCGTNGESINKATCIAGHVMIAFGYREIQYSLTSGGSHTDKYLYVASGTGTRSTGYMHISENVDIDTAFAVVIS